MASVTQQFIKNLGKILAEETAEKSAKKTAEEIAEAAARKTALVPAGPRTNRVIEGLPAGYEAISTGKPGQFVVTKPAQGQVPYTREAVSGDIIPPSTALAKRQGRQNDIVDAKFSDNLRERFLEAPEGTSGVPARIKGETARGTINMPPSRTDTFNINPRQAVAVPRQQGQVPRAEVAAKKAADQERLFKNIQKMPDGPAKNAAYRNATLLTGATALGVAGAMTQNRDVPERPPIGKRQGGRLVAPTKTAPITDIDTDEEDGKQDTGGYVPSVAKQFKPLYKGLSDEQKDEFNSALAQIRREYDDQKETLGRQELAERLGAALTQLGAGLYGMNTGEDMSGLKFQQTDWEKRLDRALDEFRAKRAGLETDRAAALSDVAQRTRSEEVAQSANLKSQRIAETANLAKQRMAAQDKASTLKQEQATSAKEIAALEKERNLRDKLKFDLRTLLSNKDASVDDETADKIKNKFRLEDSVDNIKQELKQAQSWVQRWIPLTDDMNADQAVEEVLPMVYNKIESMRPATRPQQSAPASTGYIITDSSGATQRVNTELTAEQIAGIQRAGGRVTRAGN